MSFCYLYKISCNRPYTLEFVLYSTFLIIPDPGVKLILIGVIGFFNAGWYSILKGNLYTTMPGQCGTVMTLGTLFGLATARLHCTAGVGLPRR
jgi:MFS transporter, FSR family, fosmidomycin resistance protein